MANRDSDDIAVIDTKSRNISHRIKVGKHPFGLAISQNGSQLYVVNVVSNSLTIIDTNDLSSFTIKVGEHPYCVSPSKDGKWLYVTNTQDDSVSVINLATKKVIAEIKVGQVPEGVNVDLQSGNVYVANWGSGEVTVIDGNTHKVIQQIKTGDKSRAFGEFIMQQSNPAE